MAATAVLPGIASPAGFATTGRIGRGHGPLLLAQMCPGSKSSRDAAQRNPGWLGNEHSPYSAALHTGYHSCSPLKVELRRI